MNHALATVVIPFDGRKSPAVKQQLDKIGNPAKDPLKKILDDAAFVHFLSIVVVPARGDELWAHLVLELSADGDPAAALEQLALAIPNQLLAVLEATGLWLPRARQLGAFLESHRKNIGLGWFQLAGLAFVGTPGMSVKRIRDERALAAKIRAHLEADTAPSTALAKLERVRNKIFADINFKWAFLSEPVPLLGEPKAFLEYLWPLVLSAFRDFLWPLLVPPPAAFLVSWLWRGNALDVAFWHLIATLLTELVIAGLIFLVGYRILRRDEENDVPVDIEPDQEAMRKILKRENQPGYAQNHLGSVSILKPGLVRTITLRIALWLIGESGTRRSKPGFIDKIGSIHFARWIQLPRTNRLVFLSNYDGSWQSYLEDFIARLREGLTSVWSNTVDFPKTANLVAGGAGDGARFKRWARRQQMPTRFWYSAYPDLTTAHIRTNAAIRHGFAGALDETEAAKWLALFGYSAPENIESEEVPTLVFGGLPKLRYARCLLLRFSDDKLRSRRWLTAIAPHIWYGDRGTKSMALVTGFTCSGLEQLGVDKASIATFPVAFQDGMAAAGRARTLGDDPGTWDWGSLNTAVDALLVVYATTKDGMRTRSIRRRKQLEGYGLQVVKMIRLDTVPAKNPVTKQYPITEAFGFRDGISQPIMRGSREWTSATSARDSVEPGELVLGYRDNHGKVAPLPRSADWDIGRNGTYLVVRQLKQNVAAFDGYVSKTATAWRALRDREENPDPRIPPDDAGNPIHLEHWIAAKMVGRWKDGSSLVRNPVKPATVDDKHKAPDNAFQYGREDADGLRCPIGAHVRRANPRDSFEPGSQVQLAITNRHRILRVGRNYRPEKKADGNPGNPGLLFMCVNADIERQFEFLQQTWILGPNFHGLKDEIDPVVGCRPDRNETMTVPTPRGPLRLDGLKQFVTVLGGGYFFMPGKSALWILANGPAAPRY